MSLETNKQTVLAYVEAFNQAEWEVFKALFTDDALIYGVGGMDQAIPIWRELHEAFALQLQVELLISEGNAVAVRYTERGQSVGSFRGQEATGKLYEVVAMEWFEMRQGLIHRRWAAEDSAAQFRQMGFKLS